MPDGPGFDPYAALGVGVDADAVVIQLAYKARIREAHPDVAGDAGLDRAKRLNVARDWLLDPGLRAQLGQRPSASHQTGPPPSRGGRSPNGRAHADRRPSQDIRFGRPGQDPLTFDFGPRTGQLRAFLRTVGALSSDERARVNYSLGDARPLDFEDYRDYFDQQLWSRSRVLRDAVRTAWATATDEGAPFVLPLGHLAPSGFLVANAWAQWVLLGDFFRAELRDAVFRSEHVVDSFAARCSGPWEGSIGQYRYGPNDQGVRAFFQVATALSDNAAERLARSWLRNMGRDGLGNPSDHIGPGVWLPAPPNYPEVLRVSGYLAAVDASRVEPPTGLDEELQGGFRYGLRLTAHVLALGLTHGSGRDYLRPWRDALGQNQSAWSRLRSLASAG